MDPTFLTTLKPVISKLVNILGDEIEQAVKNKIIEYQVSATERNGLVKNFLHSHEPIRLSSFYQPLYIKSYRPSIDRNSKVRTSTENISNLFLINKNITIVGPAGCGKSTLINYLFLQSILEEYKIPIKIELRDLNKENDSILTYLYEKIFKLNTLSINKSMTKRLLASGRFIIFLDGVDEIISNRKEQILNEIKEITQAYYKNLYVISSRNFDEIVYLPSFTNYEVCEFTLDESIEFVKKQKFNNKTVEITNVIKATFNDKNIAISSFLANPLLLSMFILTFNRYPDLPKNHINFYYRVFDTLYYDHDNKTKGGFRRQRLSGLSEEQ